jgi:hypothetical protein
MRKWRELACHLISERELRFQTVIIWDEKSAFTVSYTGIFHFPFSLVPGSSLVKIPPFLLDPDGLFQVHEEKLL